MKRRSVFADKLKEFPSFVFGDEAVTQQRGRWCRHFEACRSGSLAPVVGGEGRGEGVETQTPRATSTMPSCHPSSHAEVAESRSAGYSSSLRPSPSSLVLEIGCYDAQFLARVAAKYPDINFVGIDWKARPLYLGAQQIAEQNLSNLALLRARAQDLTTLFAEGELDEIWLLHPEPCDRENERANRLMGEPFLLDVHRLLSREGRLIVKTDHREYFDSTLDLLRTPAHATRFAVEVESRDFWNDVAAQRATTDGFLSGERTFYESRFVRKKQPIYYLQIRRV